MSINWHWPGWTFIQNMAENAGIAFAGTLLAAMVSSGSDLGSVNWLHALSQAGYVGLTMVLAALASLKIGRGQNNGTASFLPDVVAKPAPPISG